MSGYRITFVQYHEYWVEADNEYDAVDEAEKKFEHDMLRPVAHTHYDEVEVEEEEEYEEDEE